MPIETDVDLAFATIIDDDGDRVDIFVDPDGSLFLDTSEAPDGINVARDEIPQLIAALSHTLTPNDQAQGVVD